MPHTFINCLSRQWGGIQHKWYQGSSSCLVYFAGVVWKMYCPTLWNKSRAGQGTLVLISRIIIHGRKAAALVTKSYSNQDKESISSWQWHKYPVTFKSYAHPLPHDMCVCKCKLQSQKSRIRETKHHSTYADSSTNTKKILLVGQNLPKN